MHTTPYAHYSVCTLLSMHTQYAHYSVCTLLSMHTTQCSNALSVWNTWPTTFIKNQRMHHTSDISIVYLHKLFLILFFISSFQCAVCNTPVFHFELHFPSGLSLQWSGVAAGLLSASLPVLTGVWSVLQHRDSRGRRAHTGAHHTLAQSAVKAVVLILALEHVYCVDERLYPTMQCCKDLIYFQCSKEAEVTSLMMVKAFKTAFLHKSASFSSLTGCCWAA